MGGYGFGGSVYYNTYFGIDLFQGRSYYGGHYGDINDNHYTLFNASGISFVAVSLSYYNDASIRQWANETLQTYSDRRGIIISHHLLDGDDAWGGGGTGSDIFNTLQYRSNLFLMLGGHIKNYVRKTSQGIFGNNICTLVQDYSGYPDEHYPDNGYIRLMQFCPATNQINVKTYSPDVNTYLTSSEHQFTLNYNMSSYSPNLMNVTWQTNASGEWVTFNTSTNKTNGTYYAYNTTWVNEYNITYYWSVNCTDGTSWTNETYWFNTEDEPSSNPPPNNPGSSSPDEENEPPIANAGGPYNGTVNQTIVFNASKSDDPDGEILWYRWNFTNDSTWDTSWLTTSHINYTYNQSGNYTVVLQVKDISGSTDLDSTPALILLVSPSNETENTNQPTPPPSTNTSNETSGTNNNKQSPSQTPGFELLYCLCSVIFLLSINRKTPFLQNGDLH